MEKIYLIGYDEEKAYSVEMSIGVLMLKVQVSASVTYLLLYGISPNGDELIFIDSYYNIYAFPLNMIWYCLTKKNPPSEVSVVTSEKYSKLINLYEFESIPMIPKKRQYECSEKSKVHERKGAVILKGYKSGQVLSEEYNKPYVYTLIPDSTRIRINGPIRLDYLFRYIDKDENLHFFPIDTRIRDAEFVISAKRFFTLYRKFNIENFKVSISKVPTTYFTNRTTEGVEVISYGDCAVMPDGITNRILGISRIGNHVHVVTTTQTFIYNVCSRGDLIDPNIQLANIDIYGFKENQTYQNISDKDLAYIKRQVEGV